MHLTLGLDVNYLFLDKCMDIASLMACNQKSKYNYFFPPPYNGCRIRE